MKCPWCEGEMQAGEIRYDGRANTVFRPEGTKRTLADVLGGVGILTAARGNWFVTSGILPANYCDHCGKMVIETKVTK